MALERQIARVAVKRPCEHGFGVLEWLVATVVVLLSLATLLGVLRIVQPQTAAAQRSVEVDQRLRSAVVRIADLLREAGGALPADPRPGALAWWLPPVFPQLRSVTGADGEFVAADDRFTVYRISPGRATALASPMALPTAPLELLLAGGCPAGRPACGFGPGDRIVVADVTGQYDTPVVGTVGPSAITTYAPARLSQAYGAQGATLVAGLDVDALAFEPASRRLRLYRGSAAGMPFADVVETMRIRYFGDPAPPRAPGAPGRASCVVDETGAPRLPALAPTHGRYAELTPAMLSDGPACGAAPHRFDADLLRVRAVRVTLRMAPEAGPATGTLNRVDPREVTFDVAIRNHEG